MKWIKRYWFNILLCIGLLITEFLLLPAQERYYLPEDLSTITGIGWHITLITAAGLFVSLLIVAIAKKALGWGAINVLIVFAFLAFFFKPFFETATLFVNRQFPGSTFQHRFIVETEFGETVSKHPFLYELATKKSVLRSDSDGLLPIAPRAPWRRGDTIQVTFHHGLLGVPWFQNH